MRKFLSLVLALVMVMSLTTLTAGAKEFTDADSINYDEAVDVISALGVVDGYAGGEFGPSGQLTRQAAAKIICNLILGPTTAHALRADAAPFPDVPTSGEFAGYIAYCANRGIIGGYPDGTFRPGGSLTGFAFMKMLLGALDYDAAIEGFGGPNWSINVGKRAMGIGLDDGLLEGFDGNKAITREEAALFALNTLKADMVTYGQKITITDANGNPQTIGYTEAKPVEQANSGYKNTMGASKASTLQFAEKYFEDLKLDDTAADDFGRPSNEWTLKSTKIGTYGKTADLVASYNTKASRGNIYDVLSSAVRKDIEDDPSLFSVFVDGVKITSAKTASTHTGASSPTYTIIPDPTNPKNFYERNSSEAIYTPVEGSSRRGTLTEVYVDSNDNSVDIVFINTYVYQATSDYSESRDDVKMTAVGDTALVVKGGELTLNGEDFNLTDIKTDDYLLITAASDTWGNNYEVQSVAVAEKLEGEVSSYVKGDSVTIDGTKYEYSATATKWDGREDVRQTDYTVGQNAIVVLDAYGNIIAIDEAVSSSSFVFIKQIGSNSGLSTKAVADAYFADGTNEEISLDRVTNGGETYKSGSTILDFNDKGADGMGSDEHNLDQQWYTYSVNNDGKYVLYDLASNRSNKSVTYARANLVTNKQILFSGKVDFMAAKVSGDTGDEPGLANEKTIVIVKDKDGDVTAYTGTNSIPDIKFSGSASDDVTVYYVKNEVRGYAEYAFVSVEGETNTSVVDGGEDTSFLYVLRFKDDVKVTEAKRYYNYTVIGDEAGVDVRAAFENQVTEDGVVAGDHPYKLYYKPRYNSDERVSNITKVPDDWRMNTSLSTGKYVNHDIAGDKKITYKDGSLHVGNDNFVITSDSKLTLIVKKDASTQVLLGDKGADHEIWYQTTASNIDGILKDYIVTGHIAGATKSSTSSVVDELYITVTHIVTTESQAEDAANLAKAQAAVAALGTMTSTEKTIPGHEPEMTEDEAKAAIRAAIETKVQTSAPGATVAVTFAPGPFTPAHNADTDVDTASDATVVVTKVVVTLGNSSDEWNPTGGAGDFTVKGLAYQMQPADALNADLDLIDAFFADTDNLEIPGSDPLKSERQVRQAIEALVEAQIDNDSTVKYAYSNWTAARNQDTNGGTGDHAAADGYITVRLTVTNGTESDDSLSYTFTVKGLAFSATNAGKVDTAKTAIAITGTGLDVAAGTATGFTDAAAAYAHCRGVVAAKVTAEASNIPDDVEITYVDFDADSDYTAINGTTDGGCTVTIKVKCGNVEDPVDFNFVLKAQ